jgi:uncharacterized phage-associated protein
VAFVNVYRDRLINAIVFFAEKTKYCGKIKLFSLLYMLDFEHFRQTGKSVTGSNYQAWKFGPVPSSLMEEWKSPGADLSSAVSSSEEQLTDGVRQTVKVRAGIRLNAENFTPRQLRIMDELSHRYADVPASVIMADTQVKNGAWHKVWRDGAGERGKIPYALAVPDDAKDRHIILQIAQERQMYEASNAAEAIERLSIKD